MIISSTPFRMSFVGGGSDLPSYYLKHGGAVVSTTINKYIFITVNKKFDNMIRASYSITEFAKHPNELKHELIRETLKLVKIYGGVEITSISDIPSGTGLGSSSTYTVGLINALNAYLGKYSSSKSLAVDACKIEIELCEKPIGKQDQYAAAYGGFNLIEFHVDGSVEVSPIVCKRNTIVRLQRNLLMLYTGLTRSADKILKKQNQKSKEQSGTQEVLGKMVKLAYELRNVLSENDLDSFGEILDVNWCLKRKLSDGISNEVINEWYATARANGAIGGKILGAGGGGFLLLYAHPDKHKKIISSLPSLVPIDFSFESDGSKIVFYDS